MVLGVAPVPSKPQPKVAEEKKANKAEVNATITNFDKYKGETYET